MLVSPTMDPRARTPTRILARFLAGRLVSALIPQHGHHGVRRRLRPG